MVIAWKYEYGFNVKKKINFINSFLNEWLSTACVTLYNSTDLDPVSFFFFRVFTVTTFWISQFFGPGTTEETYYVEMCIWCIVIGIVWISHSLDLSHSKTTDEMLHTLYIFTSEVKFGSSIKHMYCQTFWPRLKFCKEDWQTKKRFHSPKDMEIVPQLTDCSTIARIIQSLLCICCSTMYIARM
jgi:hypothetical protein